MKHTRVHDAIFLVRPSQPPVKYWFAYKTERAMALVALAILLTIGLVWGAS